MRHRAIPLAWWAAAVLVGAGPASTAFAAEPAGGDGDGSVAATAATDPGKPPLPEGLAEALAADAAESGGGSASKGSPSGTNGGFSFQSFNPELSIILDVAGAYFDTDAPMMSGGHDPTKTGFNLQQLELAFGAAVDPYFRMDGNLVFGLFGVELEEAYATTLGLPAGFQVRLGQFLTRFGRLNNTHPHSWDFVDQPFVLGRHFGGENNRGLGAEVSVLLPLPWYVELVGSVINADGAATKRSFYGADDLGIHGPDDFQYTPRVEQFFELSPAWSLLWGLSAALGPNGTGRDNETAIYGTDLYLKYRPLNTAAPTVVELQAEWLQRNRQVPGELYRDHGGYAYLFWRFARRWGTAVRYEYGSPIYDHGGNVTVDDLDPAWIGERHRASGNVTFRPTEFSRFRLQANRDIPTWRDPYWGLFLAAEFTIGAHGAHKF